MTSREKEGHSLAVVLRGQERPSWGVLRGRLERIVRGYVTNYPREIPRAKFAEIPVTTGGAKRA